MSGAIFTVFVVAIFWVVMINLFRGEQSTYSFGLISLGGTLGAAALPCEINISNF